MSKSCIKVLCLFLGTLCSVSAMAGVEVSEGNVLQQKCGASRFESLFKMGKVTLGRGAMVVNNRQVNAGKPLVPGEILYYVAMREAEKTYTTDAPIEIVDDSPLTNDVKINSNKSLSVIGSFTNKSGDVFDLVSIGQGFANFTALVNNAGFLCSDRLNSKTLVAEGAPNVYQKNPLKQTIAESQLAKPKAYSVAVSYVGTMGATVSLETAIMLNGMAESKQVNSYDIFSPAIEIGDLRISAKAEGGNLTVKSVNEPSDFYAWLQQIRPKQRK